MTGHGGQRAQINLKHAQNADHHIGTSQGRKKMNKTDARKIADTITNQQLSDMFEEASKNVRDWTKRSSVNKGMSLGTSWNVLALNFDISHKYHVLAKKNMIWEFGDFLPDELKIKKEKRNLPKTHHQEPIFN